MKRGYDYLVSRAKYEQDRRLALPLSIMGKLAIRLNAVFLPDNIDPIYYHRRVNANGRLIDVPKITTLLNERTLNSFAEALRRTGIDEMPQADLVPDELFLSGTARVMAQEDEVGILTKAYAISPSAVDEWMERVYPLRRSIISTDSLRGHLGQVDYSRPRDCVNKLRSDILDLSTVNRRTNWEYASSLGAAILRGSIQDNRERERAI